jgi:hypothetical protein
VTCPECGQELAVGSWPFCAQGHEPSSLRVVPDDIPGGREIKTLGITVHSRSQLRAELNARGLQPYVQHEGGHEGDRCGHTQRFVSVDLEAAQALAERQAHTRAPLASAAQSPDAPSPKAIERMKVAWEIAAARK